MVYSANRHAKGRPYIHSGEHFVCIHLSKKKGDFRVRLRLPSLGFNWTALMGTVYPRGTSPRSLFISKREGEIDTISSRCASLLRGKCKPPNTMDIYTSALSGLYLGLLAEINTPSALPLGSHSTQIASSLLWHKALTLVVIEPGLISYFPGPTWSVVVRKISCPQVG